MANTYTQLYVMIIFAVKGRQNVIQEKHEVEIHKYLASIVRTHTQKLICLNGGKDHIHILASIKPDIALSDLIRAIKSNSSKWINTKKWYLGKFHWQKGYAAFSYSYQQLDDLIFYIEHQKEHHQKISFQEEYIQLLKDFGIEYNDRYIF